MCIVRVSRRGVLAGLTALGALVSGPVSIEGEPQFQSTPTAFSGQATVVRGRLLGIPVTLVDTGTIAPEGGKLDAHLLCYPGGSNCAIGLPDVTNGALTAEVFNATVVAHGDTSRAAASVAEFSLDAAGHSIRATLIQARARAACSDGRVTLNAESVLAALVIDGQEIAVGGEVNQRIDLLDGGAVLINEQIVNAERGDITVRALHIMIPGLLGGPDTDLVIAEAHADIQCGQRFCPQDKDFITGGGWLDNPRKHFAVAGGIKNGSFWGHLLYTDQGAKVKVKGTRVTAYVPNEGTSRHIEGECEINGRPCTYKIDVDDRGEPGREDTFALRLDEMPVASGPLEGGNIQLHTCK